MSDAVQDRANDIAARFRRLIRTVGPIPLARYMGEANAHYYATRDPLGATGDFVTAPEISQMFGEMIGGWLADIWVRAGAAPVAYVELGPGRGSLARDALRVLHQAGCVPDVHFVEGSRVLRQLQSSVVPEASFHDDTTSLPENRPLLVVANEFFDALPVRQLVRTPTGWRERMIGLENGRFVPVAGDFPMDAALGRAAVGGGEGTIVEVCPAGNAIMHDLAARIAVQGGALLCCDYGHVAPRTGSTLQAVRAHERVDPFARPGSADLTAHVDLGALAATAKAAGCEIHGLAEQGAFLSALGIGHRAEVLARRNPHESDAIRTALHRLTASDAMGRLFKVLGAGSRQWPPGAGFAPVHDA